MISYDRNKPLVFLHVPKTAGVSVRNLFEKWYGEGLYKHYRNTGTNRLPSRRNWQDVTSAEQPVCLFGHFNAARGFGVEDYYPDARQFVTILRDPLERAISGYYYTKKTAANWKDTPVSASIDLDTRLRTTEVSMLDFFPRPVSRSNYKDIIEEYFVEVGLVERLSESMARIAKALGFSYAKDALPHLNATPREDAGSADARDHFMERFALDYDVFNYVRSKYEGL